jgi:hypothetical protein
MGPKTNAVLVPGVRKVASSYAVMVSHPQDHPRFCPTGKQRVRLVKSGQPPMRDMEN